MDDVVNIKTENSSTVHAGRPTIGFFNWEIGRDWSLVSWLGICDAARQHDVNLISFVGGMVNSPRTPEGSVYPSQSLEGQAESIYALAGTECIDGLIVFNSGLTSNLSESEIEEFCRRAGVPVVTIEGAIPGTPCITYGNYEGICTVMEHLIEEHGYRRIAFVGLHNQQISFRERWRAYTDSMKKYNLPIDEELYYPFFSDEFFQRHEGAVPAECVQRIVAAGAEAVVGVCDWTSIHLMNMLHARDIRIPQDIAVASFDDFPESRVLTPPLTTINPGWYELGQQAVRSLIDLLEGRSVSALVPVTPQLMVRQSCGCLEAEVKHAAVRLDAHGVPSPIILNHKDIALKMLHATGRSTESDISRLTEDLVHECMMDIENEHPGAFLRQLDTLLRHVMAHEGNLPGWHNAISVLRRELLGWAHAKGKAVQAENLWQQARVLLAQMAERVRVHQQLHAEEQFNRLQGLGQALITTFDVERLMDVLAEQLPQFGILRCYLSLYEHPETYAYPAPAPEWSRLILAYDASGRAVLPVKGRRFHSTQLVPPNLLGNTRLHLLAEPLFFQQEQIGFVLFEPGPREGNMYEALRSQISSALQGALLVQRVQNHAAEITRQKYILDTFMASVPDSIYFKDRGSRFTHANTALARKLGLDNPADVRGKSDFDFFPKNLAHSKHAQEQAIMQTGQPLLAEEEPDAGGGWSLTTKIPLRDEHGDIIGIFGISRDITDLKQTQFELHTAYQDIQMLNNQLQQENFRMSAELDVSRRLQQMVLPTAEELQQVEGLDIVGFMQPADEVGGDYYDVLRSSNGTLYLGIGDVTGHGLESGVLMIITQTIIRTLLEHGETDMVSFLTTLNRTIYQNTRRMKVDKTLTFSLINYQGGQMNVVGQHEEVIVVRAGGRIERIDTVDLGFPIGLQQDIQAWVQETSVNLTSGDSVVLYTDGITEAVDTANKFYGIDRLCEVISQHWEASAEAIKQAVIADVTRHIGMQKVYDDITLVVLKQK